MADYDRRNNQGPRGGYNNRKRRYRDDDDYDHRSQRRRYEEPLHVKVRKQLLGIAESPLKKPEEEISSLAKLIAENYFDVEIQTQFLELALQLIVEQPLKIPFLAAIVLVINPRKPEVTGEILAKVESKLQSFLKAGQWREVKLLLRFLGCLQGLFTGDGVFPILGELFDRAVDLQTASSEDTLGLELVKIILLTIPYIMASSATGFHEQSVALLDKTDIIASTPHALEALVNPYPASATEEVQEPQSVISLLQRQLQGESEQQWKLACIPRAWDVPKELKEEEDADGTAKEPVEPTKHSMPQITVPATVSQGPRARLPEIYFSVYADQEIETVPPTSDLASSILRDALVDTINILDYNRNATAKFLIDVDCYFAPGTFVKRATQFDKLRNVEEGRSTWKPEDVAVDAVFSQLLQLPTPDHKLVYYHSVLTEACKIAPAAIAPSLGRAIRWLYQNVEAMDLELVYRFMDWFSHHLSNFGFTWKWTEWVDDVSLLSIHPKKAFILGALEKEIRLSFASRIKGTLPEPYRPLINTSQEEDTPPFKYSSPSLPVKGGDANPTPIPYAEPARDLLRLIKSKALDTEIQGPLTVIQETAAAQGVAEPLIPSTDAYVTAICFLGSKSLSHTLALIERCKERLLSIGPASEAARRQIISSVLEYWADKPGVGVNVVDKLLNYTILTPSSVVLWALGPDQLGKGEQLIKAHVYEMVASTVAKVTNRVRQIVIARNAKGLPSDQVALLDETLSKEREGMSELFKLVEDALVGVADGSVDAMAESQDQDQLGEEMLRAWGKRWLLVFRRRMAIEESWILETLAAVAAAASEMDDVQVDGNGNGTTIMGDGDVVFENGHGKATTAGVEGIGNGEPKEEDMLEAIS